MAHKTAIVILAAGASSRMRGGDKLLEKVRGQPLLRLLVSRALQVSPHVFVTLPPGHLGVTRAHKIAEYPDVAKVIVADADHGMSASFRAVVPELPDFVTAALFIPADMPQITQSDIHALITRCRNTPDARIVRAAGADGTPGHPVLFRRDLFGELAKITGDTGAKQVIAAHKEALVIEPLPADNALVDLDTPEDWAAWRARLGRS